MVRRFLLAALLVVLAPAAIGRAQQAVPPDVQAAIAQFAADHGLDYVGECASAQPAESDVVCSSVTQDATGSWAATFSTLHPDGTVDAIDGLVFVYAPAGAATPSSTQPLASATPSPPPPADPIDNETVRRTPWPW